MGEGDRGPLGSENHQGGLPLRIHLPASDRGGLSTHPDPTRGTKGCVAPRGAPEPIGKEGDRPPAWAGGRSNNVILLLGAQEGQQMAANHKSKTSESAYQAKEVPYGNSQINPAPTAPRAVGHVSGSCGRVPPCTRTSTGQTFPVLPIGRRNFSIQGSALWSVHGATGLYPDHKGLGGLSAAPRRPDLHVSGRLAHSGGRRKFSPKAHHRGHRDSSRTRLDNQPREVLPRPVPETYVPGLSHRLYKRPSLSLRGAESGGPRRGSRTAHADRVHGQSMVSFPRLPGQSSGRGAPMPFSDERSATPSLTVLYPGNTGPFHFCPIEQVCYSTNTMVVLSPSPKRGNCFSSGEAFHLSGNRRLLNGLGSAFSVVSGSRHLVRQVATPTHKHVGIGGSTPSTSTLPPESGRQDSARPNGQHYGGSVHKQTGRDEIPSSVGTNSVNATVVHREPNCTPSSTSPRQGEHHCGPTVTPSGLSDRMVSSPANSAEVMAGVRPTGSGLVCLEGQSQASNFLRLDPRPSSLGGRRIHNLMVSRKRVRLSSSGPRRQSSSEGGGRQVRLPPSGGPQLAGPTLVPTSSSDASGSALHPSSEGGSGHHPRVQRETPQSSSAPFDCLAVIRQSLVSQGLSGDAADLASRSRRSSTLGMYSARLRIFREWCNVRTFSPSSAPVGAVADFLTEQFKAGKAISTVRGFRSAIAAVHRGFSDGSSVSDSGPLEQLVRGMFLERPTIRNLAPPWNMQLVLETLAKPPFEPLSTCPMKELSIKTAFLLSAASARRRGAIHALSLREGHIRFDTSGVRLVPDPSFIAKNQTLDFLPEPIVLPKLSTFSDTQEDRVWCPVRCLKAYIKRTQSLRGNESALFVSINSPHKHVSRDTISRWIVQAISYDETSLLDSRRVKAHQVRGMTASMAFFRGVPINDIMRAAVWRTPTTFVSAYLKDVAELDGTLASKVLAPAGSST